MNVLVKMEIGHRSTVGLFVTTDQQLQTLFGKLAQFNGMIVQLEETNFTMISDNEELLIQLIEKVGDSTIIGYNPFECLVEDDEEIEAYEFEYEFDKE